MIKTLDSETFQNIYSDKKFRNQVAYAGVCRDKNLKFLHKKTCSYPVGYIVTDEQIEEAKAERKRSIERTKQENAGKLILIGMGSEISEKGVFGNYRARGFFLNDKKEKCFVEVGTAKRFKSEKEHESIFVDFAFICHENGEEKTRLSLNKKIVGVEYVAGNILRLINRNFGASFKEIHLDNYDLSPDCVVSVNNT